MKKEIIIKLVSASMALCILSSCGVSCAGNISSTITKNENQSTISNKASKEETSSTATTSDKDDISSKEEESSVPTPVKPPVSSKDEKPTSSKENTSIETSSSLSNLPYYMPQNNPEPISIHKENAEIPSKFSYAENIAGSEIGFTVRYEFVDNDYTIRQSIAIIKNYDQLKNTHSVDLKNTNKEFFYGEEYVNFYNESFFDDKALIVIFLGGTSSCEYEIKAVLKQEKQMCVHLKTVKEGKLNDSVPRRIFIEVDKSVLNTLNTVVVYHEKPSKKQQ